MLEKKKRISKKKIKEDKLVTKYYQFQKFYEENQSKIFMVIGLVAAVVVVIVWYNSKIEQDNLSATTELSKVIPIYETGSYQEAIDGRPGTDISGLRKIVDNYGGTEQGEAARIYLANAYFFLGDFESAKNEYENYSGSNNQLIASAYAGSAACLQEEKDYETAAGSYLDAAGVFEYNPMNAEYLIKAGKNMIETKNNEKAEEIFLRVKKEYGESQAAREVDRYLALVSN